MHGVSAVSALRFDPSDIRFEPYVPKDLFS